MPEISTPHIIRRFAILLQISSIIINDVSNIVKAVGDLVEHVELLDEQSQQFKMEIHQYLENNNK